MTGCPNCRLCGGWYVRVKVKGYDDGPYGADVVRCLKCKALCRLPPYIPPPDPPAILLELPGSKKKKSNQETGEEDLVRRLIASVFE